jgi:hypothetical protein
MEKVLIREVCCGATKWNYLIKSDIWEKVKGPIAFGKNTRQPVWRDLGLAIA